MTISDKIRVYELSRDLNLENKDILDAAQKLSISVKSHSSSISLADAKKIKNHISKKNPSEKIISVNKPSFKKETNQPKNIQSQKIKDHSKLNSPIKEKTIKVADNVFKINISVNIESLNISNTVSIVTHFINKKLN